MNIIENLQSFHILKKDFNMNDRLDVLGPTHNQAVDSRSLLEENHNISIVKNMLPNLSVDSQGFIVEYGSWRGNVLDALSHLYGKERVFGFDINNFTSHSQIYDVDVRTLCGNKKYAKPIALAWNDCDDWEHSPATKQAAMDHALNNLIGGGIYIEHKKCPSFVYTHENLTLIHKTKYLLFFKFNE